MIIYEVDKPIRLDEGEQTFQYICNDFINFTDDYIQLKTRDGDLTINMKQINAVFTRDNKEILVFFNGFVIKIYLAEENGQYFVKVIKS